jgi:hypothetical protein
LWWEGVLRTIAHVVSGRGAKRLHNKFLDKY